MTRTDANLKLAIPADLRAELDRFLFENHEPAAFRRPSYPSLNADFSSAEVVGQMHSAFATPEMPILVTHGLANCVGLLAFDSAKQFAFLGHTDSFSFLYNGNDRLGNPSISSHVQRLFGELARRKDETFTLTIIIAKGECAEKEYIDKIRANLSRCPLNVTIQSISEVDVKDGSIGIDIRTGTLMSYDPKIDPTERIRQGHPWIDAYMEGKLKV